MEFGANDKNVAADSVDEAAFRKGHHCGRAGLSQTASGRIHDQPAPTRRRPSQRDALASSFVQGLSNEDVLGEREGINEELGKENSRQDTHGFTDADSTQCTFISLINNNNTAISYTRKNLHGLAHASRQS